MQVYVHDQLASVARPVKQLKGFARVTLAPGRAAHREDRAASPRAFALWNAEMKEVVEPGLFDILVGAQFARPAEAVALEVA